MCGIAVVAGPGWPSAALSAVLERVLDVQTHRGPDDRGRWLDERACVALGSNRLSIVDRTSTGHQPMTTADGSLSLVFNGEIYNAPEIRQQLGNYRFRGRSDTEVFLAAFEKWGTACLNRMIGMFAFAIWERSTQRLICGRDRFGVKPLYVWNDAASNRCVFSSEIKGIAAAGAPLAPDLESWRQYLAFGLLDHSANTFYQGIYSVPAGHIATWHHGRLQVEPWYDLPAQVLACYPDERAESEVEAEYLELLEDSVRLRLRADVPIGVTLSGGLDSALLLALVERIQGRDLGVDAFTFATDDPAYDERPWARKRVHQGPHRWHECLLTADDVPAYLSQLSLAEDEPFGGIPSVAYGRLFAIAKRQGVSVLLDGQGMDEQWGGYDYHANRAAAVSVVQGSLRQAGGTSHLDPTFYDPRVHQAQTFPEWSGRSLLDVRLRDTLYTKLPRALRFNDRLSMMHSCELREPFLDHRLVELALSQPDDRIICGSEHKVMLRRLSRALLPEDVRAMPKRPVQTPQREWLSGPLAEWVRATVNASDLYNTWYLPGSIERATLDLQEGRTDHSFVIWQMLSVALWEPLVATGHQNRNM